MRDFSAWGKFQREGIFSMSEFWMLARVIIACKLGRMYKGASSIRVPRNPSILRSRLKEPVCLWQKWQINTMKTNIFCSKIYQNLIQPTALLHWIVANLTNLLFFEVTILHRGGPRTYIGQVQKILKGWSNAHLLLTKNLFNRGKFLEFLPLF